MPSRLAIHKQERNQLRGLRRVKAKHTIVRVMKLSGACLAWSENKFLNLHESYHHSTHNSPKKNPGDARLLRGFAARTFSCPSPVRDPASNHLSSAETLLPFSRFYQMVSIRPEWVISPFCVITAIDSWRMSRYTRAVATIMAS